MFHALPLVHAHPNHGWKHQLQVKQQRKQQNNNKGIGGWAIGS